MDVEAWRDAVDLFEDLDDPRVVGRCKHRLADIVMITLVGLIGPCEDWEDVVEFGRAYEDWFKRFLTLEHGIPSHDTFARVFGLLDPACMHTCFERWLTHLVRSLEAGASGGTFGGSMKTIAIDGKTLRLSNAAQGEADRPPLHLVSAWAHESGLVLAQRACDEKSNEITAIPELLEMLDLEGVTVTIDAMGCQKAIAQKLRVNKADYALALKSNHARLHTQAVLLMSEADDLEASIQHATHRTDERGHGREETRVYTTVTLNDRTTHRVGDATREAWPGLEAIGRVVSTRTIKDKTTTQTRYYLLSDPDVKHFAKSVRGHWGIENQLHWVLDVTMGEDGNRTSKDHGPENLAILRRLALNLLRMAREHTKKSMKKMRNRIGFGIDYLEELLNAVF